MRILTITCHDVYNFGASLQAYALQRFLEIRGHECKIINYRPEYLYKRFDYKFFTNAKLAKINKILLINWMLRLCKFVLLKRTAGRRKCFDEFRNSYLKITDESYTSNEMLKAASLNVDIVIAGSDQIWNPLFENGSDKAFFLDFVEEGVKRVSYAASFAVSSLPENKKQFFREMLSKFNSISVRETDGLVILEELGLKGCKVLDPIFLLDVGIWKGVAHSFRYSQKYILIYDFEGNKMIKETAEFFKKKMGYKIFSINDSVPRCYADKNFTNVGPIEFISLILSCSLFLSNSFHGTAFSIYFNRPFYVFNLKGFATNSRMINLLETFKLTERLVTSQMNFDKSDMMIDWDNVNSIIDEEKKQSVDFLMNAIYCDGKNKYNI